MTAADCVVILFAIAFMLLCVYVWRMGVNCPHRNTRMVTAQQGWDIVLFVAIGLAGILVAVWMIATLAQWLLVNPTNPPEPLTEILKDQWHWLKSIRVW